MCIFESRTDSPSQSLKLPIEIYEQQEALSGVDMMVRHFRSQSFRDYQARNPPSPCPSRSPSQSPYHTPSPDRLYRRHSSPNVMTVMINPSVFITSPETIIVIDPCTFSSSNALSVSSTCVEPCTSTFALASNKIPVKSYSEKQQRVFSNLITDT